MLFVCIVCLCCLFVLFVCLFVCLFVLFVSLFLCFFVCFIACFFTMDSWDQIGFLGLPDQRSETSQFLSLDNITVTKATWNGVKTLTLKEVCSNAAAISIRPLDPIKFKDRTELLQQWFQITAQVLNQSYEV